MAQRQKQADDSSKHAKAHRHHSKSQSLLRWEATSLDRGFLAHKNTERGLFSNDSVANHHAFPFQWERATILILYCSPNMQDILLLKNPREIFLGAVPPQGTDRHFLPSQVF